MSTRPRRRGRGEGSIWQRADGRWEDRLQLAWTATGRKCRAVYAPSQDELIRKLKAVQHALDRGQPVPDQRLAVAAFLERRWLPAVAVRCRPRFLRLQGKGGRERQVPIMPRLAHRLERYATRTRPGDAGVDRLFLSLRRGVRTGTYEALTPSGVEQLVRALGTCQAR